MSNLRFNAGKDKRKSIAVSPKQEKERLLESIRWILETKSNASLSAILSSLESTPDSELKYPQIKRAQRKFSEFLARPEAKN